MSVVDVVSAARAQPANTGAAPGNLGGLEVERPPPPTETPTRLTLFERPDMSGVSHTVAVAPPVTLQIGRVISWTELKSANLGTNNGIAKAKAARLVCGTRPSLAALFSNDWRGNNGFYTKGRSVECNPGETKVLVLEAGERIGSAAVLAHVRSTDNLAHRASFAFLFGSVWKTEMSKMGDAVPTRTVVWIEDFSHFRVTQFLKVNHWACTERDAHFDLRISVRSGAAFKPVFAVELKDYGVRSGFGDFWGCGSGMRETLLSELRPVVASLPAKLPESVPSNPSSPTFYFGPGGDHDNFDLYFAQ
jgi:hypothetical protein